VTARRGRLAQSDELTIRLAYGRVSGREQADEGLSLPNQFRRCRLYNADKPGSVAGEEFCDVDSGRNDDRTHYQRMKLVISGLVAAGKRVSVTVLRLDRLGRTARERLKIWEELDEAGVEIHAIEDGGLQQNKLVYTILAGVAENEAKLIGDRVCDVWDAISAAGWHKPGRAPWGYRWRPASAEERGAAAPKSVLELDEPTSERHGTADAAREMWRRYASGSSAEAVLRWIAGLSDADRDGRRLMGSGVRTLLRSPVYIGRLGGPHDLAACVEQDDGCEAISRPNGRWAPLIDDAMWMRAHAQYGRQRRLPAQASGAYLLTGLLRCASCGGRMVGNPGNRARARRDGIVDLSMQRRYICSARLHGDARQRADPCYATVLARKIEAPVLLAIMDLLERVSDPTLQEAMRAAAGRKASARILDQPGRQIGALQATLTKARHTLSEATQRFFRDEISKLAYDVVADEMAQKIEQAEQRMAELRGASKRSADLPIEALVAGVSGWHEALLGAEVPAQRALLAELVETVRPVRHGHGRYGAAVKLGPKGEALLTYACEAAQLAAGPAGMPEKVAVGHMATAMCRTATPLGALAHGSGHTDDHTALRAS
jgi:DNA invertase Pin-like site-specific DNA recombinase